MAELNKTQLTNKLKKLGKFIKENKENDSKIYNKIQEIFPNSLEVDVSKNDIHFITTYQYIGKISKKEIKEKDDNFKEVLSISNIDVFINVDNEDISITSSILIEYFDKFDLIDNMDIIIKELNL